MPLSRATAQAPAHPPPGSTRKIKGRGPAARGLGRSSSLLPPLAPPGSGAGGAHAGRARAPTLPAPLTRRTPRAPLPSGRGGGCFRTNRGPLRSRLPALPDPRSETPDAPPPPAGLLWPASVHVGRVRDAGCGMRCVAAPPERRPHSRPRAAGVRRAPFRPSWNVPFPIRTMAGLWMDARGAFQQKRTRPAQWNHSAGMSRRPSAGGGAGPPTRGSCSGSYAQLRAAACSSCPAAAYVAAGRGAARALCSGVCSARRGLDKEKKLVGFPRRGGARRAREGAGHPPGR